MSTYTTPRQERTDAEPTCAAKRAELATIGLADDSLPDWEVYCAAADAIGDTLARLGFEC